jgi:putative methionine-R-sulfoxide reductase with GAF domain
MERLRELHPGPVPAPRRREQDALLDAIGPGIDTGPALWGELPAMIHGVFGSRGWAWNGIYAKTTPDQLHLIAACGPPVCATLERSGGPGSSGMCWDGILLNQTLAAQDVHGWPGYVSCDPESGLSTAAGMVCPIRDRLGAPVAVWDLDSLLPLEPEDPPFFDRLFATLSALGPPLPIPRD